MLRCIYNIDVDANFSIYIFHCIRNVKKYLKYIHILNTYQDMPIPMLRYTHNIDIM